MDDTITLHMDAATRENARETRYKPAHCKYPVIGIPWWVIPYPDCEMARQEVGYIGLHLQLTEIEAKRATELKFGIDHPMVHIP